MLHTRTSRAFIESGLHLLPKFLPRISLAALKLMLGIERYLTRFKSIHIVFVHGVLPKNKKGYQND